ncbi:unnamed protein product, partial [Choristocarpus tenellus]
MRFSQLHLDKAFSRHVFSLEVSKRLLGLPVQCNRPCSLSRPLLCTLSLPTHPCLAYPNGHYNKQAMHRSSPASNSHWPRTLYTCSGPPSCHGLPVVECPG